MLHVTGPQEVSAVTELNTSLGTLGNVGASLHLGLGLSWSQQEESPWRLYPGSFDPVLDFLDLSWANGALAHFKVKSNLSLSLVHKPKR